MDLIITTMELGRFFAEIGRPGTGEPPTPADITRFVEIAAKYGYTLATPGGNAAVGIQVPKFSQ